mmetsp:Transcript_22068/g.58357  ORF Transcript_22068/g.58357 Transcript_22068/m.58357 type:complete len:96 (-) Transcript_22068:247-534(-)|eukprot:CAMPEP_0194516920 /NCGR_PEP_ID=MMETSP0253-20130528/49963_1 /TAXON_ID=2966 /ORGANISM="Noctiluca scintillans" /LENGTH=95 /DNA_ID=CAMNT_0039360833 /DNA_START=57 /DNA_END=344 /DNA_ORIENTATION=-
MEYISSVLETLNVCGSRFSLREEQIPEDMEQKGSHHTDSDVQVPYLSEKLVHGLGERTDPPGWQLLAMQAHRPENPSMVWPAPRELPHGAFDGFS